MLDLKGRTIRKQVEAVIGQSLLDHAIANQIDWQFSCTRGTCARCRCLVLEGGAYLAELTDAEWDRLDDDEIEEGYRLGCQAMVKTDGNIVAENRTYW